jgi:hypothetical protein
MSATVHTASAPAAPRRFRFSMLIPTLLVDVAAPIAILKGLEALGVPPVWALAAGCVPPAANNLRTWIANRRVDPAGILIMISMATGVAGSIISGNLGSKILTDCLVSSAWGFGFLGSLLMGRPAPFYLIRALVAGEDGARIEAWNGLWRYAAFRSTQRWLAVAWGLSYFAGIALELVLVRLVSLDTLVTIGPVMGLGTTVLLIVYTRWRIRRVRARLECDENLQWPL